MQLKPSAASGPFCLHPAAASPPSPRATPAHLVGAAESGPQSCQHLHHSPAAVALQGVDGRDPWQGLEEAHVFLHHVLQICHEKCFSATLERKKHNQHRQTRICSAPTSIKIGVRVIPSRHRVPTPPASSTGMLVWTSWPVLGACLTR